MVSPDLHSKAQIFFEIQNFELADRSGLSPWSVQAFLGELQHPWTRVFEWGAPLSGFVLYRRQFEEVEIMFLALREKGKGAGTLLLQDFFRSLKSDPDPIQKVFLEVSNKNYAAVKCYIKAGFKVIGSRRNYYQNGDTALNMLREL